MTESDLHSRALAARAARRAAVASLAAELGHDLQAPLNLFRLLTERLTKGQTPDGEDISLLQQELERLARINGRLRELSRVPLTKIECSTTQVLEAALACSFAAQGVQPALELELGDASQRLVCDPAVLGRAVAELIDNAIEARAARAGVRFETGAAPAICVWDDGASPPPATAEATAFGVSTRPGAAGMGLTLALRAARAHGFGLDLRRHGAVTEARLLIPLRELKDLVTKGAG